MITSANISGGGLERVSDRLFTRSLNRDDGTHYITHTGSAFAVMALAACDVPSD